MDGILHRRALPKPIPGIPYNVESSRRRLGDAPHLLAIKKSGRRVRQFWYDLARRHDRPVIQFFMPFSKPCVVVWDFREAQDLLVRRSKELDRGWMNNDMWQGALPHHFIAMDTRDPRFVEAKAVQKDLMTPSFLYSVSAPASYDKVLHLIELWSLKARLAEGRPFEALEDLNHFTADVIFAAALGIEDAESSTVQNMERLRTIGSINPPTDINSVQLFPETQPQGLLQSILKLYWLLTNMRPKNRRAQELRKTILQEHIDRARVRLSQTDEKEPRLHAAVDYMVSRELSAAEKAGRAPMLNTPLFNDLLFGYCLGGQDTTHSVLSFLVKQLSGHQETQSQLRSTLRETYSAAFSERRNPNQQEITRGQVPFLDAFIYEVLRCDTPSPFIIKQTLTDMNVLGTIIPKGTPLFFPLFGASLDEPAFPIPESARSETSQKHSSDIPSDWVSGGYPPHEFHAERWLRTDERGNIIFDQKAGPFLSFGAGVRECWGMRLARLQLKLATTLLVWNFEFEALPGELVDSEVVDVLNAKPKKCFVRLKKIDL
ncbi:putative cytochrome P450 [Byssothecium circinans]|uniref:Putative cytochrome P450 n=1 Tax=Byssothecium circinans TaxID=147558 RepID=A0A6A5TM32_9PLEO|nr:putative cytochrome P450 [Byssothecium circinans]